MPTPHSQQPDWVHGHPHDPNPAPPSDDATFTIVLPNREQVLFTVAALQKLPFTKIENCTIVSTGHGRWGPFSFGGVRLLTLIHALLSVEPAWSYLDVHSEDGFGARMNAAELQSESMARPSLLAWQIDGVALTRQGGLVRLIVPSETDDALKQVKWVKQIVIYASLLATD